MFPLSVSPNYCFSHLNWSNEFLEMSKSQLAEFHESTLIQLEISGRKLSFNLKRSHCFLPSLEINIILKWELQHLNLTCRTQTNWFRHNQIHRNVHRKKKRQPVNPPYPVDFPALDLWLIEYIYTCRAPLHVAPHFLHKYPRETRLINRGTNVKYSKRFGHVVRHLFGPFSYRSYIPSFVFGVTYMLNVQAEIIITRFDWADCLFFFGGMGKYLGNGSLQ